MNCISCNDEYEKGDENEYGVLCEDINCNCTSNLTFYCNECFDTYVSLKVSSDIDIATLKARQNRIYCPNANDPAFPSIKEKICTSYYSETQLINHLTPETLEKYIESKTRVTRADEYEKELKLKSNENQSTIISNGNKSNISIRFFFPNIIARLFNFNSFFSHIFQITVILYLSYQYLPLTLFACSITLINNFVPIIITKVKLNIDKWKLKRNEIFLNEQLLINQLNLTLRNPKMCGFCYCGPVEHDNCNDLTTHHNENYKRSWRLNFMFGRKIKYNNSCKFCGWFSVNSNNWPKWNKKLPGRIRLTLANLYKHKFSILIFLIIGLLFYSRCYIYQIPVITGLYNISMTSLYLLKGIARFIWESLILILTIVRFLVTSIIFFCSSFIFTVFAHLKLIFLSNFIWNIFSLNFLILNLYMLPICMYAESFNYNFRYYFKQFIVSVLRKCISYSTFCFYVIEMYESRNSVISSLRMQPTSESTMIYNMYIEGLNLIFKLDKMHNIIDVVSIYMFMLVLISVFTIAKDSDQQFWQKIKKDLQEIKKLLRN